MTRSQRGKAYQACLFVAILVVLVAAVLYARSRAKGPSEQELIASFYAHRAAYERLREMLQADGQLLRVADWGVETRTAVGVHSPPENGFPAERYSQYLVLLKETGGKWAFRGEGEHPTVGVGLWASGWGGNTRHVDIYWVEGQPDNQVASLDEGRRSRHSNGVSRHIDGHWYLWTDR